MEPNFYTETATVLNADADFRSLLKPSALLRYVEQVSADHARAFGMDDKFFRDHNVAFLVGKQALQFVRVPRRTEALTLTTRAEHSRRGAIKRITTVTDAAGKLVATVDCRWILVDLTGGHIMREPNWTVEGFWNETVEGELSLHTHRCRGVQGQLFAVRPERPHQQRLLSGSCLRRSAAGGAAGGPGDLCRRELPPGDPHGGHGGTAVCTLGRGVVCAGPPRRPHQL